MLSRLLSSMLLTIAITSFAFGQKETLWFEPDFNSSYCYHHILYNDYFGQFSFWDLRTPTYYASFISSYARRSSVKTVTRTKTHKGREVIHLPSKEDIKEVFTYNKAGYLISYKRFYMSSYNYAYQIAYSYDRRKRVIVADYRDIEGFKNNSDYQRIIYKYNKRMQLISKTAFPRTLGNQLLSFYYDEERLLTAVCDSFFMKKTKDTVLHLLYRPVQNMAEVEELLKKLIATSGIKFDSITPSLAFRIIDNPNDATRRQKTVIRAKNFMYAYFRDGEEYYHTRRYDNEIITAPIFKGTHKIHVFDWASNDILDMVYQSYTESGYYPPIFILSALRDLEKNVWLINVVTSNRLKKGMGEENKSMFTNRAQKPLLEFKYDGVHYAYHYEYFKN